MVKPLFSVIIPTIGRRTLERTLLSIPSYVETIVVVDTHTPSKIESNIIEVCKRVNIIKENISYLELDAGKHDIGSSQIDYGMRHAEGQWLLNFGDDDVYEPYAFQTMTDVISKLEYIAPIMFRVALHPTWPSDRRGNTNIAVLWQTEELKDKNITGQCFVCPNDKARLGNWFGDIDTEFIITTIANYDNMVYWREEIIAQCY